MYGTGRRSECYHLIYRHFRSAYTLTACAGVVTASSIAANSSSIGAMAACDLAMMTTTRMCSLQNQCKVASVCDRAVRAFPSWAGLPQSHDSMNLEPRMIA
jgi:hypothetical protein